MRIRGEKLLSFFSPLLSLSLSLSVQCFFVSSYFVCFVALSPLLSPPLLPGQRKALTPWLLPGLHCQLFFFIYLFFLWRVGRLEGLRVEGWVWIENKKQRGRPLSLFSHIRTLTSPFKSHPPSFLSIFFLCIPPPFLLIFALSFLIDNTHLHTPTLAHPRPHTPQMVSQGAVDRKIAY